MRRLITAVLIAAAAMLLGPPARAADDPIDSYMRQYQAEHDLPGLAFAIVRGDTVERVRTWGPGVTEHTPFLIGSVSKPVTALAVMQLVESRQLDLDAPARRYLPWFRLADDDAARSITVRQLLQHTSGLAQWALATDRFGSDAKELGRAVRELADVEPEAQPGEKHIYSDANYLVLAAIVEEVTGEPYGEHLRTAVLDPLDMRDAVATTAEAADLPPGHRYWFGQPREFSPEYDASGVSYGYLGASLSDLTHFVTAQLHGGQILSADGVAEMHRGATDTGATGKYGLGWREGDDGNVWHAGATPGSWTHIVLVPGADLGVIVMANAYSPAIDGPLASGAFALAQLAQGKTAAPPAGDYLFPGLLAVLALVAVLLVVAIVLSIRRPRGGIVRTVLWWLGCAALIAAAIWLVPALAGGDFAQAWLWTPDLALTLTVVIALASAMALVRLVTLLRKPSRTPVH